MGESLKRYADGTLLSWTKKELLSYIRMQEKNYDVLEEFYHNALDYSLEHSNVKETPCKECEFFGLGPEKSFTCTKFGHQVQPLDFCAWAERRSHDY